MKIICADDLLKHAEVNGESEEFIRKLDDYIKDAPTIEERKKGKWILVNGRTAINCSVCWRCSWSLSFEDTVRQFNFCPNCGADMRGE